MAEANKNLWAPWRMDYIRTCGTEAEDQGCFLCRYWESADHDDQNQVVWRTPTIFVTLNRFPYTNGHLLVAVGKHKADLGELTDEELCALNRGIRDGVRVLRAAIEPHGFNIGYNLGRCAGAGLPGHLHAHIVPRWNGDTNFMAVVGDARVIPESLKTLYEQLRNRAKEAGLLKG